MLPCPPYRQPHRSVQRRRTWLIATVSFFLAAACLLAKELEIFEFLQTGPNHPRERVAGASISPEENSHFVRVIVVPDDG